ncbi:hypothetical protein RM863_29185 [Streptomyces sp. DSM 41014]|uniref:Uncharacterized protein n=1 Tax=Streptomyces hintoniae TaxID=3075521 RepID=A0ABU2UTL3_9ACTN|nr:hypothetical protein [Streptomyces sp. DSM 41014]MDT0476206.1 hypothetical protein [Streptomyces sp. DSM 41014]
MELIEQTYLHPTPLTHAVGCPTAPAWDVVDVLETPAGRVALTGYEPHRCPTEGCGHEREFSRLQVRVRCTGCDIAHIITGEALTRHCTTTAALGWGQPPQQHAGLWVWPGEPTLPGRDPNQYLVTRTPHQPTRDTLYGVISGHTDSTWGAPRFSAGAVPDPDADRQISMTRVRYLSTGHETLTDALDWIASVETSAQRPLVVSV